MSHPPHGASVSARRNFLPIHLLGVSALALACALPQPVAAQALSEAQTTILERIVLTATRQSKSVLDVPKNITVIDQETIERHVVRDIQDLVRYEPGITVSRQTSLTNPFGQLTSFNIRGVGSNRVQILVDGSRVQEQITDGSRDFVDPWNMKAVELVRGPNSVLWGADALGGVAAFRTREPADLLEGSNKPWALEIKTAWDSFDNSFKRQITGAYDFGDFEVLASLGQTDAEEARLTKADPDGGIWGCTRPAYFRCNLLFPADTEIYNGLLKGVWTPTDDHKITATYEFFDRNTTIDQIWDSGSTQGTPTGGSNTSGGTYNSLGYIRDLDMTRSRFALSHEWEVGADWLDSIKWNLSYSPQRRTIESNQDRRYALRDTHVYQIRDYGETFLEADVQLNSSFELLGMSHNLTYGFDGDIANTEYEGTNVTTNYGVTPPTETIAINQGFNFPQVDTTRADFYIQDEIELLDGRLTVTPGIRYATYSIDPTGDEDYVPLPGFEPEVQDSQKLIKTLGAIYRLDDSWSIYAAYGEGFKMPTSQQLFVSVNDPFTGNQVIPNPNLRPESVASYEAGFRGEFDKGWLSVGGFYAEYTDFIRSFAPVAGQPDNVVTYDNLDSVKLYGIEASAEFEIYENLFASGALTWSEGTQETAAGETAFDGAVPLTVVAGLRYEIPEHSLEFEVIGTFAQGVTERSDPNAFKPEGYAVFDAYAKYSPTENVELTAGVQNIFDVRYFPNTLTGYANSPSIPAVADQNPLELQTAPGRTFKLGATVRF